MTGAGTLWIGRKRAGMAWHVVDHRNTVPGGRGVSACDWGLFMGETVEVDDPAELPTLCRRCQHAAHQQITRFEEHHANEEQRPGDGVSATSDPMYRRDMIDAGRGHLLP